MVAQTIRLATGRNYYTEVIRKLLTAAGKINAPKQKKYNVMWDIHWAFNHVFQHFKAPSKYIEHIEQFIVVFRLLSGWRSADLGGITREGSFKVSNEGVYVRNWNSKVKKRRWSQYSFFPKITDPRYATFCIPSRLQGIMNASKGFAFDKIEVDGGWQTPLFCKAIPDDISGSHEPLSISTIKQKFKHLLLDSLCMKKGTSLSDQGYGPHSARHANASALLALGVSAKEAAEHQQTSEQSLTSTYAVQVITDWDLRPAEVQKQSHIVSKLLTPFMQWHENN